jgi:3-deoxy-manno-octulosonate cytidylyltransferase (CMP-KDO synthetase)
MLMKALIVIPARYGATRFPGKPLVLIKGKPLIQLVWERASRSKLAPRAVVATDDGRIAEVVRAFGGEVVMTRADHLSGTDRMAEVARKIKAEIYVNVQGDEPTILATEIDRLIRGLGRFPIATLAHVIETERERKNSHVVKVVAAPDGRALYFSRSPIPYPRHARGGLGWRHVGVYAYRAAALRQFVRWKPSPLELTESLEQLRALENGLAIRVIPTKMRCQGVDTPADLRHISSLL